MGEEMRTCMVGGNVCCWERAERDLHGQGCVCAYLHDTQGVHGSLHSRA